MNSKKLLTLKETADLLDVPTCRIYYLVFHKQIPFIKLGTSLRFDPDKLGA